MDRKEGEGGRERTGDERQVTERRQRGRRQEHMKKYCTTSPGAVDE